MLDIKKKKNVIVIGGVVFITYTVLFLWGEIRDLSFSKKINDQKISNYWGIIGISATAISLLYFIRQTKEMEKARVSSTLPKIYPENMEFYTYEIDRPMENSEGDQELRRLVYPVSILGKKDHVSEVTISNVDHGTALNLEVEWRYDVYRIREVTHPEYHYEIQDSSLHNTLNYINPQENAKYTELPWYYFQCLGELNKRREGTPFSKLILPNLRLHIKFEDIHGLKYNVAFNAVIKKFPEEGNKYLLQFSRFELKLVILDLKKRRRFPFLRK